MASIKNVFCSSNPANLPQALWTLIQPDIDHLDEIVIFLPSRRAVRSVEQILTEKIGHAIVLPTLVPLGEGADDLDAEPEDFDAGVISNQERVIIFAKILTAYPTIRNIAAALPVARDLVRLQDYLENEGIDTNTINWSELVDEKYATHFQQKAEILDIIKMVFSDQITVTKKRNSAIRDWENQLENKRKVIVCGSTASVPATADLMAYIATRPNGIILLPGKIDGNINDFERDTNPYYSEYKFLKRINVKPEDVQVIDIGPSSIDFFNKAFGNSGIVAGQCSARLIECSREAEEAECVAEIAAQSVAENKTVLIITPDAAGNQRASQALNRRGVRADFSGGISGTMTAPGRAILNLFDDWIENKINVFDACYQKNELNLFETLVDLVDENKDYLAPSFDLSDPAVLPVWDAIKNLSDSLGRNGVVLGMSDARAFIADCLSGVSVRPTMSVDTKVCVLGTIESRMQTADVVVLTGLNEGMFPDIGYENAWLPKHLSKKIGLPSGNRKVSLMALDFINLSCGASVYWLRSKTAGGSGTTESRFLSRVSVAQLGGITEKDDNILSAVRNRDRVPSAPLDYSPPRPPADMSDVYVTNLDYLINNPYAFYARHILRLYPKDDYWHEPDLRDFGNLVHSVIEEAVDPRSAVLIAEMDKRAREILQDQSVQLHFWHKRFVQIAPIVEKMLTDSPGALVETLGSVRIADRVVRAKADRIWDGVVLDIKTNKAPTKDSLEKGMMPQLPLEAFILQSGGFNLMGGIKSKTPVIQFLQLQNNNVELIEYDAETTQKMIDGAFQKVSDLFKRYSNDYEPYEYVGNNDKKYKIYDDLARVDD